MSSAFENGRLLGRLLKSTIEEHNSERNLNQAQKTALLNTSYEIAAMVPEPEQRKILHEVRNQEISNKAAMILGRLAVAKNLQASLGPFAVNPNKFQSDYREFDRRLEENDQQIAASVAETHKREASMEYKLERMRNDSGIGSIRGASRMTDMQLIEILKEEQESDKRAAELSYQPW